MSRCITNWLRLWHRRRAVRAVTAAIVQQRAARNMAGWHDQESARLLFQAEELMRAARAKLTLNGKL